VANRIYLVGNGASLRHTNLDLLAGLPSMAVNKIHLIYPQTRWRPTHYVKVDYSIFDPEHPDDWRSEIMQHVERDEQCLLWNAFYKGADRYDGNYEWVPDGIGDFHFNVRFIPRCEHHYLLKSVWHPICTGGNSILTMVLWAVELGFGEIVLVGCDGKYTNPREDHLHPDYYSVVDGEYEKRNNECVRQAHEVIAANCPVPIYDATVNGSLDFYPKVRLEAIVKEEALHRGATHPEHKGKRAQNRKASSQVRQKNRALDR
jgi:hypothetical protein